MVLVVAVCGALCPVVYGFVVVHFALGFSFVWVCVV